MTHGAPAGAFSLGYRPFLDGIRGIGVLLVMAAHSFIASVAAAGMLALQMFFVLSGFLITAMLVREWDRRGDVSLKNFYVRRALRLLPALLLFLGTFCVVAALLFPTPVRNAHLEAAVWALFYLYNWGFIYDWFPAGLFNHCWSLAVEEQFYLLWPLTLVWLLRSGVQRLWILLLPAAGIAASSIDRALLFPVPRPSAWRLVLGSDMHADSLLLGCLIGLLAFWGHLPRGRLLRPIKIAAAIGTVYLVWHAAAQPESLAITWNPDGRPYDWQVLRVLALGAVFVVLLTEPPRAAMWLLELPVIVWLGRRSYGIYLWHFGINGFLLLYMGWPEHLVVIPGAILSFAIAAASYRWVELPFLALKGRYAS